MLHLFNAIKNAEKARLDIEDTAEKIRSLGDDLQNFSAALINYARCPEEDTLQILRYAAEDVRVVMDNMKEPLSICVNNILD